MKLWIRAVNSRTKSRSGDVVGLKELTIYRGRVESVAEAALYWTWKCLWCMWEVESVVYEGKVSVSVPSQEKRKEKHLLRRAPSKSQSYTIKNAHIQNEFSALFSVVMYCSSHWKQRRRIIWKNVIFKELMRQFYHSLLLRGENFGTFFRVLSLFRAAFLSRVEFS